jgi:hypothetical protein
MRSLGMCVLMELGARRSPTRQSLRPAVVKIAAVLILPLPVAGNPIWVRDK